MMRVMGGRKRSYGFWRRSFGQNKVSESGALINHGDFRVRPAGRGRLENNGDGSIARSVGNLPEFAREVDGAVFFNRARIMQRED